jgi:protein-tyrosine-phosphatase/DNA-binding transcriptional ArsR family regulator
LAEPGGTTFFRLVADPARAAILRVLAQTDLKSGEIAERLNLRQNTVSYHLGQLRNAGLLLDHPSHFDARDIYYSLDFDRLRQMYVGAGAALHPGLASTTAAEAAHPDSPPVRVLFLCTHNSARSQMAEALTRVFGGERLAAHSAGSEPAAVHPLALAVLAEWGIDGSELHAKAVDTFNGQQFDYIITVCDRVREVTPRFDGNPTYLHWSLPDPLEVRDEEHQRPAFETIRSLLRARIRHFLDWGLTPARALV